MTDLSQIPAWVVLIDALSLQALRTHFQVELDLRAVLRSQSSPEDVLSRAERILERGVEVTRESVLMARAIFILNRVDLCEEQARRLGEQIAGMYLLLLARVSGWACVEYFRKQGKDESLDMSRNIAGLIPLCVGIEGDVENLFARERQEAGIPAA